MLSDGTPAEIWFIKEGWEALRFSGKACDSPYNAIFHSLRFEEMN